MRDIRDRSATDYVGSFFPQFDFVAIDRSDVLGTLKVTDEFRSACPASATVMRLIVKPG